jgi:hypothetical protein
MNRPAISGSEPSLREVLDDPIVRLVMARDNVGQDDLKRMIETHRGHRAADLPKTGGPVGGRAGWIPLWVRSWAGSTKRIHG